MKTLDERIQEGLKTRALIKQEEDRKEKEERAKKIEQFAQRLENVFGLAVYEVFGSVKIRVNSLKKAYFVFEYAGKTYFLARGLGDFWVLFRNEDRDEGDTRELPSVTVLPSLDREDSLDKLAMKVYDLSQEPDWKRVESTWTAVVQETVKDKLYDGLRQFIRETVNEDESGY